MLQEQSRPTPAHKLVMQNREKVELTGITEVVSFDNKEVILETVDGMLQMKGEGFHVKHLTLEKGEVDFEGRIDSLVYSDQQNAAKSAGSFVSRLFR